MKPLPPTKLKAGQAIGAADRLVDTFNWLVDATENLKGDGCFIYVNKQNPEVPAIELDLDSLQDWFNGQLSSLSGGGSCSCEMSASLATGTKIGSFTNDGWQTQVDLYAPSGGSGTSTTLFGNTAGSQQIDGDISISSMVSSCVSAFTTDVNGQKILSLGVYYI